MLTGSFPLFSIGDLLRRIADILKIDAGEVARSGAQVLGVWLLAFLAYRVVGLLARRIERTVDDGDESVTTTRERRGQTIAQLLRSMGRVVIVAIAILSPSTSSSISGRFSPVREFSASPSPSGRRAWSRT